MSTNYTPSGNPTAETRGISSQVRAEFQLIASAVNVKGDRTGETWTGTHDFTGGTLKAATATFGATGNAVATLDFVNLVAMNAALPGQTGNLGKLVTTNGTSASWTDKLNASVMKWADGTDPTKLVQMDLSGITTGTTRTLAAPNASGTLVLTSDITSAKGTSMALLGSATVSTAVANIDFLTLFTSGYDRYVIDLQGAVPSASDTLSMQLANVGVVDTGVSRYGVPSVDGGTMTNDSKLLLSAASFTTNAAMTVELRNANDATNTKGASIRGFYGNTAVIREGRYSGPAISGFRLFWTGGANFTAGTVRVYGIKNS